MVPGKFAWQIRSEAERAAQHEDLKLASGTLKCGSRGSPEDQRGLRSGGNEGKSLRLELTHGLNDSRTLQNSRKSSGDAAAASGNGRIVLIIPNIARAKLSRAAAKSGQAGAANQGRKFSAEDFITKAQLATAPESVAEVKASPGTFVAEHGNASLTGKSVARQLGDECKRRNEEMRVRDRLVELRCGQIARSEQQVIAPFAAVMLNVHKRDARAG